MEKRLIFSYLFAALLVFAATACSFNFSTNSATNANSSSNANSSANTNSAPQNKENKASNTTSQSNNTTKTQKETTTTKSETTSTSNSGNFEGVYQVGETTCMVRPSKMSYEVSWEQGSGVEMYFVGDDNKTFDSESEEGQDVNSFIFTDTGYNTGKFYRRDGAVFAVKRVR